MRTASRLALFLLLAALSFAIAGPLVGMSGLGGITAFAMLGAVCAAGLLATTWICIRATKSSWRAVGIELNRRRLLELAIGFLAGSVLFAVVLLAQGLMVGGSWQPGAKISPVGVLAGLAVTLALLLSEELLFRGYAFRQIADTMGPRVALIVSAIAFGAYHLVGSENWGMGALFTFAMPTLGGLVFGYALLRSGSLALPIGLHWGGNWVQSQVFGLGHLGENSAALWTLPLSPGQIDWLRAPDLVQHLPYVCVLGIAALVLWRLRFPAVKPG